MDPRAREALQVIRRNTAPDGFYTGDDYRQYWLREVISFDALIALGHRERVEAHLSLFLDRMEPTGRLPAMIPTREGMVRLALSPRIWLLPIRYRGPYLLRNLGQYLDPAQRWTSDSNILALTGLKLLEGTGSRLPGARAEQARRLRDHVSRCMEPDTGLLRGAGWTDAMDIYNRRLTLCGLALQHRMHQALGEKPEANRLLTALEEVFWDPRRGHYRDHEQGDRFDTAAHAILLQDNAIPREHTPRVLKALEGAATPHGYRNLTPPYPPAACSLWPHIYQNSTLWPAIQGLTIIALQRAGEERLAQREMEKWRALPGFHEWHHPATGRPDGSANMLSSAALYLQAEREVGE